MNEYLPPSTWKWCQDYLQQLGFNSSQPASDSTAPHRTIYLQLRTAVAEHLMSNKEPKLGLTVKPTGAFDWQPVQMDHVREVELADDDVEDEVENDAEDKI